MKSWYYFKNLCVIEKSFNSNFLLISQYISLFSSLKLCLSYAYILKVFQPIYAYKGYVNKKKNVSGSYHEWNLEIKRMAAINFFCCYICCGKELLIKLFEKYSTYLRFFLNFWSKVDSKAYIWRVLEAIEAWEIPIENNCGMICFSTSNQKMNSLYRTSSQISWIFLCVYENDWFMQKLFELIKAIVNYSSHFTGLYLTGTSVLMVERSFNSPSKPELAENGRCVINPVSPSETVL